MRQVLRSVLCGLVLWCLAGCSLGFRQTINRAKDEVFPAIVYLRPIQESYEGGEQAGREVVGSGVIISRDGYVVTNYHVAGKAKIIRAVLFGRKMLTASVVGHDKDTDLALLKLDVAAEYIPLPYAEFGDSDGLDVGDFVIAMGSPLGLSRSASLGIVSNNERYLGDERSRYNLWIQTDAAINPGNSGGPLVDVRGRIVGINTLGSVGGENIGFAIPSETVKTVVAALQEQGRVIRAWTGITFQALRDFDRNTVVEGDRGVLIAYVDPDSPAAEAGLMAKDLVLSVDGEPVNGLYVRDLSDVRVQFAALPTDRAVDVTLQREGQTLHVELNALEKGEVEGESFDCVEWQMTIKEINKFAARQIYYFRKNGVYVQGVKRRGNAAGSGLQVGDILLSVAGRDIDSLEDAEAVYAELDEKPAGKRDVLVKVLRAGVLHLVNLDYNKSNDEYERER